MKRMKRTLAVLLALPLLLGLLPMAAHAFYGGSGTQDDPYLITTQDELQAMANSSDYYKLANDITLDSTWTPIASFSGTLDGNGKTISDVSVSGTGSNTKPLGGIVNTLESGGVIKNLNVSGSVACTSGGSTRVGGIVGASDSKIMNCTFSGTVTGPTSGYNHAVGGIVGLMNAGSVTEQCTNNASVTGTSTGSLFVGGITGSNHGKITGCINNGTISGNSGQKVYVGDLWGSTVWSNGYAYVGGIAGDTNGDDTGGNVNNVNKGTIIYNGEIKVDNTPKFTATVTVRKNDETWTDCGYPVELRNESTTVAMTGTDGVYTTNKASESATYEVYANGVNTGIAVTAGTASVTVDYYTVTYKSGSATEGIPPAEAYALKGKSFTATKETPLTLKGYTQIGWKVKEKFQGTDENATTTLSNLNAAKELYPLWKLNGFNNQTTSTYGGEVVKYKEPYNVYQPGAELVLTAKLSHEAEGEFTRQWRTKGTDGQWRDIPGATGETYTVSKPDAGTYYYLCSWEFKSSKGVTMVSWAHFLPHILIKQAPMPVTGPTVTATRNQIKVENPVVGQKYACLNAATSTPSSDWKAYTDGELVFTDLDRNTQYWICTYTPATNTTNYADSTVRNAEVRTLKEQITHITPPGDTFLDEYCSTAAEVIQKLPTKAKIVTETGSPTELAISWSGSYDKTPGAQNTFTWTVTAPNGYQFANGVPSSGQITVTNKAATPVSHTPRNAKITYTGNTFSVSTLFTLDPNAGAAAYTLIPGTGEGSLAGNTLTIQKAGTFTIQVTTAANGVYAAGTATATLTVQRAPVPVPDDPAGKVYNGQKQTAAISAPMNGAWTVTQNAGGTDAGSYDVIVTLNTDLYQWKTGEDTAERTLKFQITQATQQCANPVLAATYRAITVQNPQPNQKYLCLAANAPEPTAGSGDWKEPADGTLVFDGLNRDTAYKVYTYLPGDKNHAQSAVMSTQITTAKEQITALTAPQPLTLTQYHTTVQEAISELPKTAAVETEGNALTELEIIWQAPATYDAAPGKTHSFTWSVNAPDGYAFGVQSGGTIPVTNRAATEVTHTPKNAEITYNGSTYDVSALFTLGETTGTPTYAITAGNDLGRLDGNTLTIQKAGTFTIQVTTEAHGVYAAGTATATLTVQKATVPVPGDPAGKVYNGQNQKAELPDGALWTVTQNNGGTNVGDYPVYVTLNEPDLYRWRDNGEDTPVRRLTFRITRAARTSIAPDLSADYHSITVTNAKTGQRYCCLPANEHAPEPTAKAAEWRAPTEAALVFGNLNRDTWYTVYTYIPEDGNHLQSNVASAQIQTEEETVTAIAAPSDTTLTQYYSTGAEVGDTLKQTTEVKTEGSSLTELAIRWEPEGAYNAAPGASNTFTWSVTIPSGYVLAQDVPGSGTITVTNKAATEVTHTPKNAETTYDGSTYDVSALFTLDKNAGAATYTVKGAGSLNGTTLTITKAGAFEIQVTTAAVGNYAAGTATATLTVHKATADVPGNPASKVYNGQPLTADMPANAAWAVTQNDGGTDVGSYNVVVTLKAPDLYKWATGDDTAERTLTFQITRATPNYTVPTGLQICVGHSTQDLTLPDGWAWKEKVELTEAKTTSAAAVFTPADTKNYSAVEQELSITVTEHTAGEWEVTRKATCTEAGSRHKLCTVCHAELAVEEVPAIGHRFGAPAYAWSQDGKNCTAARVCEHDAKHIEAETVPTTAVPGRKPTCTEKGETVYTATFTVAWAQEQQKTLEDVQETGHTLQYIKGRPATCTQDGVKGYYTCTVCGKNFEDEEATREIQELESWLVIQATGHTDSNHDYRCDVCGASLGRWPYSSSPKTADESSPTVWALVMLLSMTGLGITAHYSRKKE